MKIIKSAEIVFYIIFTLFYYLLNIKSLLNQIFCLRRLSPKEETVIKNQVYPVSKQSYQTRIFRHKHNLTEFT